jgi:DNA-binding beta-propeller fold protein YncE
MNTRTALIPSPGFVVLVGLALLASVGRADAQAPSAADSSAAAISYISVPGHPFGTVMTRDRRWLFVSVTSSNPKSVNGVAMLSRRGAKTTLKKVFLVEGEPTGMVMTHDDKLLVVADGDFVVFLDVGRMIAKSDDPIVGYISDGDFSGSVYVNVTADDRFLFVSDESNESITVINLGKARAEGFKESAIVGKIPVGEAPIALTFSPDGRWLYTTSEIAPKSFGWSIDCKPEGEDPAKTTPQYPQGAIIVVDVARAETDPANSVVARVPAGCSPVRLAITPAGDRVFVTARNSNALLAFDSDKLRSDSAHALIGTVPVGSSPVGVASINGGKHVLVTNSNRFSADRAARQTLTVIDAAKVAAGQSAVIKNLPAGAFPREFGRSPDGRTVFVANYNSNEIQVIDLDRLSLPPAP